MMLSTWAQAMMTVFRFRTLSDPAAPLSDPVDYEILRGHLASGTTVATTFYGPVCYRLLQRALSPLRLTISPPHHLSTTSHLQVSFDQFGQNNGRAPTSFQVAAHATNASGRAQVIFPGSPLSYDIVEKAFDFPSPASACPADAHELRFGGPQDCVLCEPLVCVVEPPPQTVLIASAATGSVLVPVLLLFLLFWRRQRARERRLKAALENFKQEVVGVRHVPASFDPRADHGVPPMQLQELSELVRNQMGLSGDTPRSVAREAASQLDIASEGVDVAAVLQQVVATIFGSGGVTTAGALPGSGIGQPRRPSIERARWYWKEDAQNLSKHNPATIKGEFVEYAAGAHIAP